LRKFWKRLVTHALSVAVLLEDVTTSRGKIYNIIIYNI